MTMNENMKLWKYSGTFLVITGAIHTVYALLLGKEDFTDMIKDGLINSTDDSYSRAFALWFLVCGIILILWGLTLQYYIKKEQKANEISEDEQKDAEAEVQKLTDQFVKKIDEMVESKSKEIMTV
mgnify:CR=1 FL=1